MKALILIDFINDILNRNSNIEELEKNHFFEKLNDSLKKAREK
jgi:nicotinamidase-related amidase